MWMSYTRVTPTCRETKKDVADAQLPWPSRCVSAHFTEALQARRGREWPTLVRPRMVRGSAGPDSAHARDEQPLPGLETSGVELIGDADPGDGLHRG